MSPHWTGTPRRTAGIFTLFSLPQGQLKYQVRLSDPGPEWGLVCGHEAWGGTAGTPALFGSRDEGSAIIGSEEDKCALRDPQVPEKAQDFPDAVINLPDGVPVPAGRTGLWWPVGEL